MNKQRKLVLDMLNDLGVKYELAEHPAVFTMGELKKMGIDLPGESVKNLFVCDKNRKRFFLVSVLGPKKVDLKELQERLGSKRLSFASEERLESILGIKRGAVSPLGILNDKDSIVEVVFDKAIQPLKKVGMHPNDNTATVYLKPKDIEKIIADCGNKFSYVDLD